MLCRRLMKWLGVCLMLGLLVGHADADLVGYWQFDEGAGDVATDKSGNGNDGILLGGPTWGAGAIGGALSFDGSDDIVEIPDAASLDLSDALTIAAWVNLSDLSTFYFITHKGPSGTAGNNYPGNFEFRTEANTGILQLMHQTGEGQTLATYTSDSPVTAGQWQHVAATLVAGGQVNFYIDGVPAGTAGQTETFGVLNDISVKIGGRTDSYSFFNGAIDDVQIYDHALTMEEIQAAMNGLAFEQAAVSSPADGAVDVLRNVNLSWTPGIYAVTHDVYVGESSEEVATATVPTVSGLTDTSYDLGRMDFGKRVFWRVDEVNGTPDKTVFKGDVWNFEVEPYSIQIPGSAITVTASSVSNEISTPEKTIDGSGLDADDMHTIASQDMWFTASVDLDPWIQFEFDGVQKLDIMTVWNSNSAAEMAIGWGVKDVQIEYSVDGENWDVLADATQFSRAPGSLTYNQVDEINFGGAAAKVVRLNIQSNWGGILMSYGLSEVRFSMIPAAARSPEPASGSGDVLPNATLSWRAGREAAQHTVYVSPDQNAVADGTASFVMSNTNNLDLVSLDLGLGQVYYWRVDEVNEAEGVSVWAGPVWSFSTVPALIVDDFDRYNNDSPNRPFQTWHDGFGYSADEHFPAGYGGNGTGAGVGHDIWSLSSPHYNGDLMETGLVYGGSQSVPVTYDGAGSQIDLALDGQDWTQSGLQTLSIAFHGTAGNTGQLYAKINNTKVLYDLDPADIANGSWLVWQLDLASISGLDNVTTLSIGVDGAGAAGILYLDEIALYAEAAEVITPVAPGTDNLVAHYAFDGDLLDTAGSHHGTINAGDPVFVDGVQGQGIEFIGNQDVTVAYAEDLGLNSFTISTWVNVSDIDGPRGILGTRYNGDTTFDLKIEANRIHGDLGSGTAWLSTAVDYSTTLSTDAWYHIAYVVDEAGGAVRIYLNGALAETIAISGTPLFMKAGQELHIGNSYGTVEYMYGTLDEVSIYNGVLSAAEVASLAGRTTPIYKPF